MFIPRLWLSLFILFFLSFLSVNSQKETPRHKFYEFSDEEKEMIKLINSARKDNDIKTFRTNEELSLALKIELITKSKKVPPMVVKELKEELTDLISKFGERMFVVEIEDSSKFLQKLFENSKIKDIILDKKSIALALANHKIGNLSYTLIYFPKYNLEYGPFIDEIAHNIGDSAWAKVSLTIQGKSDGRYLEFVFYEGSDLPFYHKGENKEIKELKTKDDGSFSISFEISKFGKGEKTVAVFSKDDLSEPYNLVSLLKSGSAF